MLDPSGFELPPIPNKRYFAIGEVSKMCAVKPHVLRYWEQEFPQLSPIKRRGNRRYYQKHEVKLIRRIRSLLYSEGFTVSGAKTRLEQLVQIDQVNPEIEAVAPQDTSKLIQQLIVELDEVKEILCYKTSF